MRSATRAGSRLRANMIRACLFLRKLGRLDGEALGHALIEFWEFLYLKGATVNEVQEVMCALRKLIPEVRKELSGEPLGALLAVRGFRRLAPSATHTLLPHVDHAALMATAWWSGQATTRSRGRRRSDFSATCARACWSMGQPCSKRSHGQPAM